MSLWQKVKKLNTNLLGEVSAVYSYNKIPVEVRDLCAAWIESSVNFLKPDTFAVGLCTQIQQRIDSLGAEIPFYVNHRLSEFRDTVKAAGPHGAQELHKRFLFCLEKERLALKRTSDNQENGVMIQKSPQNVGYVPASPSNSLGSGGFNQAGGFMNSPSSESFSRVPSTSPRRISEARDALVQGHGFSPNNFLNNPVRNAIDAEMNRVFEAVWSLEEANNLFVSKCHELKRHQDTKNQHLVLAQTNGVQQPHAIMDFQELEIQIRDARQEILQTASLIYGRISEVRSRTSTVLQNWARLKSELDRDLMAWTQEQRLYANGKDMKMTIEQLQQLSEYLNEVAWKLRCLLQRTDTIRLANANVLSESNNIGNLSIGPDIPEQLAETTKLIKNLVQDTFIVVFQPCQVLRNNTRFHVPLGKNDLEVGLLVGEKLGLQVAPPTVSVCIIDQKSCMEIETHGLQGDKFRKIIKKGKLYPESTRLDFNPETKRSAAIFRQISLKDYFRNGRKSTLGKEQSECVTEEKLCLLFRSEFTVGDISFQIWRTSLPIVITTHVSQDCLAWAVVTWDNAFAQSRRIPFQVTEYASWPLVSEMLNNKFESMVGAPLTLENLNYLRDRVPRSAGFPDRLSWTDLCKVDLPDLKFTFWEWFYEATKLIEQHLKDAWKGGHVMGFVDKEKAKSLLCGSGCPPGTFLFRFSDTILGGISIVWLHSDGKAYSLSPFKGKDLSTQPLVEKLDQETLHFVYPDVPKGQAFKKYFDDYKLTTKSASAAAPDDGYVRFRNQLIIDNPNIPKFCMMDKTTKSKSGNYEFITPQQTASPSASSQYSSQAEDDVNFIELDIDKIVDAFASPEYLDYVASPDTTFQQPSPASSIISSTTGGGEWLEGSQCGPVRDVCIYPDESFYMQL